MTCAVSACKEPRMQPWYVCKEHFLVVRNKQPIEKELTGAFPQPDITVHVPFFGAVRA